jgi:hypothetical protein
MLDLLADSLASARMLMLFIYRAEYHNGWANKATLAVEARTAGPCRPCRHAWRAVGAKAMN